MGMQFTFHLDLDGTDRPSYVHYMHNISCNVMSKSDGYCQLSPLGRLPPWPSVYQTPSHEPPTSQDGDLAFCL
jgi:hypothetical protein